MTIARFVSNKWGSQGPAVTGSMTGRVSPRVAQAIEEPQPLDQLVHQLRQMFTAPHERLCEARFGEVLDILEEQKSSTDEELDSLGRSIRILNSRLDEDQAHFSEVFGDALAKSRAELEQKIEQLSQTLRVTLDELDTRLRGSLGELSRSFTEHVSQDEVKREQDRQGAMSNLEQRIAQWRAEIDDMRRDDMDKVASSMMDIGQRLLAIREI